MASRDNMTLEKFERLQLEAKLRKAGFTATFISNLFRCYGLLSPSGISIDFEEPARKGTEALCELGHIEKVVRADSNKVTVRAIGPLRNELKARFLAAFTPPGANPGTDDFSQFLLKAWRCRSLPLDYVAWLRSLTPKKDNPRHARLAFEVVLTAAGAPDDDAGAYGVAIFRLYTQPTFYTGAPEVSTPFSSGTGKTKTGNKKAES